ncbi:hypothetical protein [Leptonema illini]|uniref:Uncharacterized protein n=1 Tax=Leptonema illini DSM 21528 TaxID=929563 RepID=H2CKI2_9LEPT|nr:hypothetical protein [Leptonema illini]EHQ08287.1 hypothetical protein Lepil_3630 [Leptonema illini DSM 21528]
MRPRIYASAEQLIALADVLQFAKSRKMHLYRRHRSWWKYLSDGLNIHPIWAQELVRVRTAFNESPYLAEVMELPLTNVVRWLREHRNDVSLYQPGCIRNERDCVSMISLCREDGPNPFEALQKDAEILVKIEQREKERSAC